MASTGDVHDLLLDKIQQSANETTDSTRLLRLAEAYAWVVSPNQPHGSGTD